MGGSGGSSSPSHGGSEIGGGVSSDSSLDLTCPDLTSAILVDVGKTNNPQFGLTLTVSTVLTLVQDGNTFRVESSNQALGWLPLDKATVLIACLSRGFNYEASLLQVTGSGPFTLRWTKAIALAMALVCSGYRARQRLTLLRD